MKTINLTDIQYNLIIIDFTKKWHVSLLKLTTGAEEALWCLATQHFRVFDFTMKNEK